MTPTIGKILFHKKKKENKIERVSVIATRPSFDITTSQAIRDLFTWCDLFVFTAGVVCENCGLKFASKTMLKTHKKYCTQTGNVITISHQVHLIFKKRLIYLK